MNEMYLYALAYRMLTPMREGFYKMANIAIAENDDDQREMLADIIRSAGHSVTTFDNGIDAAQEFERSSFDCIVMDVRMPRKDGITVLKELRQRKATTPVIIMSAFPTQADYDRCTQAGASAILAKPYSIEDLLKTLASVLAIPESQALTSAP